MLVLVEDAAEAVASAYVKTGLPVRGGDRRGQGVQWPGVRDALVRPVRVVELLELPQGVEEVELVPDQCAVQQFTSAGLALREHVLTKQLVRLHRHGRAR